MWDTMEKNGGGKECGTPWKRMGVFHFLLGVRNLTPNTPILFHGDTQKKAGALFWQIGSQEKMRDTHKVEREFKFVGCHYCCADATSKTLWGEGGGEHKQNMFCLCSNRICQPPMQKVPLNPSPKTLIPKH